MSFTRAITFQETNILPLNDKIIFDLDNTFRPGAKQNGLAFNLASIVMHDAVILHENNEMNSAFQVIIIMLI